MCGWRSVADRQKVPARKQLNVEVWQIYVNGKKPAKLDGGQDDKIKVEEAKAPLFYEDCFLSGPPADVPTAALGAGLDDLHELSALFPLLDNNHVIQSVIEREPPEAA